MAYGEMYRVSGAGDQRPGKQRAELSTGNEATDRLDQDSRLRHQLEVQAWQIQDVFARRQIPAEVAGGAVQPRRLQFDLRAQLGDGLDRIRQLKDELRLALGVPELRLERIDGNLRVTVKQTHDHAVDLLDLFAATDLGPGIQTILGLDDEGQTISLNLADDTLHNVLIAGSEAAGKSNLLRSLAVSLALINRQARAQMAIIAGPSDQGGLIGRPQVLRPLSFLPHLLFPVVTETDDAIESLKFLVDEVTYREDSGLTEPLLVVFIDNADVFLERGGYAAQVLLSRLLQASESAGIRLVLSAADIRRGEMDRLIKHNMSLRLIGRLKDEISTISITGRPDHEARYLNGNGDFLAESYGSTLRFQAAFIDDYDLHLTLKNLHQSNDVVLLAQQTPSLLDPPAESERSFLINGSSGKATLDVTSPLRATVIEVENSPNHNLEPGQAELIDENLVGALSMVAAGEVIVLEPPAEVTQAVDESAPKAESDPTREISKSTTRSRKMTVNQADEQSIRPGGFGRFYRPIQSQPADTDENTSNGAGGELEYDDLDDNDWQDPDWDDGSNRPGPQFH